MVKRVVASRPLAGAALRPGRGRIEPAEVRAEVMNRGRIGIELHIEAGEQLLMSRHQSPIQRTARALAADMRHQ